MEANVNIINKMLEEYKVGASREAKEAIVNFSVLFGEKLVRKCVQGRATDKKVST